MTVTDAQRRAQRNWRQRRRHAGQSWFCVALNHATCSGWIGRLSRPDQQQRPVCTCPCHKKGEFEW